MDGATSLVHATCIALDGHAALITGPPGSGKSDLALRCVTTGYKIDDRLRFASLVADDQVVLERGDGRIVARAPPAISGKLEVRGVGIVTLPQTAEADLRLVVRLVAGAEIERLPSLEREAVLLDMALPLLEVAPFEASAPQKVLLVLAGTTS